MNPVPNFTLRREPDGYVLHTEDGMEGHYPTLGAALDSLKAQGGTTPATTRERVLSAARACVCGDREQDYGSPENNFRTIAGLWNSYLYGAGLMENPNPDVWKELKPKDVAAMLALLKVARIAGNHPKQDNWIDLAGYAACGAELELSDEIGTAGH